MTDLKEGDEVKRGAFPRAWKILEHIVGHPECSAQDISQALRLALPTALRLLAMLIKEGLVEFDHADRLYRPGPSLFRLLALGGQSDLFRSLTRSPLEALTQATGETACLNLLQHDDRFSVVAVQEGQHQLRYVVSQGGLHPLDLGAGGKAILAFLPDERRASVVKQSKDPVGLAKELDRIRERGLVVTFGERVPGAVGIAVPIFRLSGEVRGSVQITLPEHRYAAGLEDSVKEPLERAASLLSPSRLGKGQVQ